MPERRVCCPLPRRLFVPPSVALCCTKVGGARTVISASPAVLSCLTRILSSFPRCWIIPGPSDLTSDAVLTVRVYMVSSPFQDPIIILIQLLPHLFFFCIFFSGLTKIQYSCRFIHEVILQLVQVGFSRTQPLIRRKNHLLLDKG